jgi:hypothetical protein
MNARRFVSQGLLAIALLSGAGCVGAVEELGRLFFTPERRELLDRQRALNMLESEAVAENPQIVVNGQVRRSSGKRTTWINGQAQNDIETRTGVVAHPTGSSHEQVVIESGDDPKAQVRIGQTLNRGTQETSDPLGNGQIVIHRYSPPPKR